MLLMCSAPPASAYRSSYSSFQNFLKHLFLQEDFQPAPTEISHLHSWPISLWPVLEDGDVSVQIHLLKPECFSRTGLLELNLLKLQWCPEHQDGDEA